MNSGDASTWGGAKPKLDLHDLQLRLDEGDPLDVEIMRELVSDIDAAGGLDVPAGVRSALSDRVAVADAWTLLEWIDYLRKVTDIDE